jgi:hypothetical protein
MAWLTLGKVAPALEQFEVAQQLSSRAVPAVTSAGMVIRNAGLTPMVLAGRLGTLQQRVEANLRDAARRGDLFTEDYGRTVFNLVWLCRDDPAGARRALLERRWTPPATGYHVNHYFALFARCEILLYEGVREGAELDQVNTEFRVLERSLYLRSSVFARLRAEFVGARLALARAEATTDPSKRRSQLERAARLTGRLQGSGLAIARVWAALMRAGHARLASPADEAELLRRSIRLSVDEGISHLAAIARRRLAALVGGSAGAELAALADCYFEAERIRNPARLSAVFLPSG